MVGKITKSKIVALYLNDYNKKYYLREMATLLKKPHQTIKPYIETLIKENILIKNQRRNITEFSLNFKNKKIYDYLIISEKEKLIERLEQDSILNILYEKISKFFNKSTFILFGSAVEKIKKDSDVDLLVIGKQDISKEIENFKEVYSRKIHKIQVENFKKLNLTFIKEIYKNHLILNNTEQIIRQFGDLYEKNKLV